MIQELTLNTNLNENNYLDYSEQIEEYEKEEKKIYEYYDLPILEKEADKTFKYAKSDKVNVNHRNFYLYKYHGYYVKKRRAFVLYKNNVLQNIIVCFSEEQAERLYNKFGGVKK
jgi:hypothetical protein